VFIPIVISDTALPFVVEPSNLRINQNEFKSEITPINDDTMEYNVISVWLMYSSSLSTVNDIERLLHVVNIPNTVWYLVLERFVNVNEMLLSHLMEL
jgi:hypothetical protein